jgi:hypothetical protein
MNGEEDTISLMKARIHRENWWVILEDLERNLD